MKDIYLLTWLLVPDPTAISAEMALKRMPDFQDKLIHLKRFSLWKISFNYSDSSLNPEQLLKGNAYLVNPNKHKYKFMNDMKELASDQNNGLWRLMIPKPEKKLPLAQLVEITGVKTITDITYYELWEIHTITGLIQKDVESMAITTSRDTGILMNPHYQECIWI
jgi:hypothetical protein